MKPVRMLLIPSLLLLAAGPLPADEAGAPVGKDITFRKDLQLTPDDETILRAFITHAVEYADKLTADSVAAECAKAPEMFAWVQFRYLDCLNTAYELTGDTKYLDLLKDRFAFFQKALRKSDDGLSRLVGQADPATTAQGQPRSPDRGTPDDLPRHRDAQADGSSWPGRTPTTPRPTR